jgi:putative endopeptidase
MDKGIDYGMSDEQLEDELQFQTYICQTPMMGAMNKAYAENYFDASTVAELTQMTQDCIDAFKVIFKEEPWLSDEGKTAAVDKLSSIGIHIAYQSFDILDYNRVSFLSKEEGGSFLDAYFAANRYGIYHSTYLSEMKFTRDFWNPLSASGSTTVTNAFYNPSTNGIYICAGICGPGCYEPGMAYEEKLAGLFTAVGHEITHGFDENGALYDKEGRKNTWLPYKDQMAFNDMNIKISAYYSTLTPYAGSGLYDGSKLVGEACADMGGLRVTLFLAKNTPDFDYDLFFRSYAKLWRMNVPLETEKWHFEGDVHPLAFYRVNVGLQQFDEFYETYGIKEGDNMYLAPEKRIAIW